VEVESEPSAVEERPIKLLDLDSLPWVMDKASKEAI